MLVIILGNHLRNQTLCEETVISPYHGIQFGTRPYAKFLNELRAALLAPTTDNVASLLDGQAGERCLDLVRPKSIRRLGAFFTPSRIAERVVNQLSVTAWEQVIIFDPSCGAADLLLPVAKRLPLQGTISATLKSWNEHLWGCDLSAEFIDAARLRLILLAAQRGAQLDDSDENLAKLLTNLVVADGLSLSDAYIKSSHIVMNPPYGRISCEPRPWRNGVATGAALFMERAIELSVPGTQIVALLPEVLRTGSSYAAWRSYIARFVEKRRPQSVGLFSSSADIDVFVQRFEKKINHANADWKLASARRKSARKAARKTIGDKFLVAVGTVVPHRHRKSGQKFAFLHSKNAPPWGEIRRVSETRKFKGRTFKPPFVVMRRTSRPGDKQRATATLILGKRKVAVENHLIVLTPKSGGVPLCQSLIQVLRSRKVDMLLNRRMRCRHLTTGIVCALPWF